MLSIHENLQKTTISENKSCHLLGGQVFKPKAIAMWMNTHLSIRFQSEVTGFLFLHWAHIYSIIMISQPVIRPVSFTRFLAKKLPYIHKSSMIIILCVSKQTVPHRLTFPQCLLVKLQLAVFFTTSPTSPFMPPTLPRKQKNNQKMKTN